MKTIAHYLGFYFLLLNTLTLTAQEYDDIYYDTDDRTFEQNNSSTSPVNTVDESEYTSPRYNDYLPSETQTVVDAQGNTTINNYYNGDDYRFDRDDYYDYAYSSRIRRFHRPINTYSYYDPFYTNMYWYNYDPLCYGTSIYLGYDFWRPSPWRARIGWNWGWNSWNRYNNLAWGYDFGWSPGWSGYYSAAYVNPWGFNNGFGWNNGFNRPFCANNWNYWNGYNAGFYAGVNNNYYNSFDANSVNAHYGHRGSRASNTGYTRRSVGSTFSAKRASSAVNTRFTSSEIAAVTPRRSTTTGVRTTGNRTTGVRTGTTVPRTTSRTTTNPRNETSRPARTIERNRTKTTPVYSNERPTRSGGATKTENPARVTPTPRSRNTTRTGSYRAPSNTREVAPTNKTRNTPTYERPKRTRSNKSTSSSSYNRSSSPSRNYSSGSSRSSRSSSFGSSSRSSRSSSPARSSGSSSRRGR